MRNKTNKTKWNEINERKAVLGIAVVGWKFIGVGNEL